MTIDREIPAILIVEDDANARKALKAVLSDSECDLIMAGSGEEALREVMIDDFAVIIMDLLLPGLDGIEVAKLIRQHPRGAGMPIIFHTGTDATSQRVADAYTVGGVDFLAKPANKEILQAKVAVFVKLWQHRVLVERQSKELHEANVKLAKEIAEREVAESGLRTVNAELKAAHAEMEKRVLERTRELTESQQKFQSIVENINIGAILIDPDMRIVEANRLVRQWFPDIVAQGLPKCFSVCPSSPDAPCARCHVIEAFEDSEVHEATFEVEVASRKRIFRVVACPVPDATGKVVAVVNLMDDITEKRSLEEQLRQAQKMEAVGQLAGGIAHDFNNILTITSGYGQLIKAGLPENDPMEADINAVIEAADRGAALTRQLLIFSRKQLVEPKMVQLNTIIMGFEKMLRRMIGEDIEIEIELDPGARLVMADPGNMEQVILNLALNSRDSMPNGGRLVIETRNVELDEEYCVANRGLHPGPYVMLSVSDTGCGMTSEVQEHLFEPFFTTKDAGKGTGLGLSVVHGIVSKANGAIHVYSELGIGTTMRVYLPVAEDLIEKGSLEEDAADASLSGSETILFVDDEEVIVKVMTRILGRQGYEVLSASNGEQALELASIHDGPIHLLITDVVMPRMNGQVLAGRLLSERPDTKVLFVSGFAENLLQQLSIDRKEVHFLPKPYTQDILLHKVRVILEEIRTNNVTNN